MPPSKKKPAPTSSRSTAKPTAGDTTTVPAPTKGVTQPADPAANASDVYEDSAEASVKPVVSAPPPATTPSSSSDSQRKTNGTTSTSNSTASAIAEKSSLSTTLSPSQASDWPKPVYYQTVILGAGVSGMCMAIQLKRKGHGDDFIILDKESDIGGTWTTNTYPGCGVDVPAPMYSFSFRQKTDWSNFFVKQPELKAYFSTVAAEFDLEDRLHLQTVVKEARFDECTNLWHIYVEDLPQREAAGVTPRRHHYVCKLFVSAVGGLSQPNDCNIPGHENFKGTIFHSATWDHSVSYKDRNVVVIGNGSSATQFVPELAKEAKNVTQVVRSQHWMQHQPADPFTLPAWKWLVRHFAFFRNLQRYLIWFVMETAFLGAHMNWVGSAWRTHWSNACIKYAKKNAPKEYLPQLIPDKTKLPPMHKRRILDDGYLACLNKPNVQLETRKTVKIEEDAVVLEGGVKIPADIIVLATGFSTARAGFPMLLYGRQGEEVREHWRKYSDSGPAHYRSTFLAGYPNLVALNGTNVATGHASVIHHTENQVLLALEVAKPVLGGPKPSLRAITHDPTVLPSQSLSTFSDKAPAFEVKLSAELSEQNWIQWLMKRRVFSRGPGSWYINQQSGRVTAMYPDWQWRYCIRCLFPNWKDYKYENLEGGKAYPSDRAWWKVAGNKVLGLGTVPTISAQAAGLKDYKELYRDE